MTLSKQHNGFDCGVFILQIGVKDWSTFRYGIKGTGGRHLLKIKVRGDIFYDEKVDLRILRA